MHVPRFVVALAVVAALFFTFVAAQRAVVASADPDHGWAGPHPSQIRSYTVPITLTRPATSDWAAWTSGILTQVLPSDFILTDIDAGSVDNKSIIAHLDVMLFESTSPKLAYRETNGTNGYRSGRTLASGIPFASGSAIVASVKAKLSEPTRTIIVTITGYGS